MPESEFDKQVQKEMEGLRIRPSAFVWENVEKELRRKKRRRFIVAFWMIAGIALLGSTTYFLTRNNDTTLAETSTQTGTPGTKSTQSTVAKGIQTPAPAQDPVEPVSTPSDATATLRQNSTAGDQPAASTENAPEHNNTAAKTPASKNSNIKAVAPSGKAAASQQDHIQINASAKNKKAGSGDKRAFSETIDPAITKGKIKRSGKVSGSNMPVTPALQNETQNPVSTAEDIAANVKEPQKTIAEATPVADSVQSEMDSVVAIIKDDSENGVPVKMPQKKEAKKIKWSLDLSIGGSGPVGRPFLIGGSNADKADYPQSAPIQSGGLWQPVNPPTNAFGPVYSPRSDINPGLSYRAGVLVDLPVSERVSFSSGLQYQYQSSNIRIGSYVNTQLVFNNFASQQVRANGVYQGVQMKTFTNKYHYVQIPFLLNWQMNKGKKLPVILNTGFSAGYLASTNALTYDTLQGGTYYHDKNAFKRFQFSFTTGVSFRFGNNRALQWSIGPEASMGLRKTVKTEYDTRQYPVYIGLQGRIYLPKKK